LNYLATMATMTTDDSSKGAPQNRLLLTSGSRYKIMWAM